MLNFLKVAKKVSISSILLLSLSGALHAQTENDTTTELKPHGVLWGSAFGDFAYKGNADNLARGNNQYGTVPANTNLLQWRRVYLGYSYEISKSFSADIVMAAENDYAAGLLGQPANAISTNVKTVAGQTGTTTTLGTLAFGNNGDILLNNKFVPYIKLANLRWKNLWKGTDLVFGQMNGPAYGINGRNNQTSEEVWAYRSIEKTVSDLAGTPCFDFGAELQGWFDDKGNFGYDVMVANGQQAKPENDPYKWISADVYAKFFDKRLIIDLYQDYEKLHWGVYNAGPNGTWYHDRNTTKLFAAWNSKKITIGFEGFQTTLLGDVKVSGKDGNTYYRTTDAIAMSFFVRGRIVSDNKDRAKLSFFARYDNFDPSGNLNNIANDINTKAYTATTAAYDPTTKTQFMVLGFDYTPLKNIHIMPNFWIFTYNSSLTDNTKNEALNNFVTSGKGTDAVWRLSFYYIFGK